MLEKTLITALLANDQASFFAATQHEDLKNQSERVYTLYPLLYSLAPSNKVIKSSYKHALMTLATKKRDLLDNKPLIFFSDAALSFYYYPKKWLRPIQTLSTISKSHYLPEMAFDKVFRKLFLDPPLIEIEKNRFVIEKEMQFVITLMKGFKNKATSSLWIIDLFVLTEKALDATRIISLIKALRMDSFFYHAILYVELLFQHEVFSLIKKALNKSGGAFFSLCYEKNQTFFGSFFYKLFANCR